jgi:hypothetical protein
MAVWVMEIEGTGYFFRTRLVQVGELDDVRLLGAATRDHNTLHCRDRCLHILMCSEPDRESVEFLVSREDDIAVLIGVNFSHRTERPSKLGHLQC